MIALETGQISTFLPKAHQETQKKLNHARNHYQQTQMGQKDIPRIMVVEGPWTEVHCTGRHL